MIDSDEKKHLNFTDPDAPLIRTQSGHMPQYNVQSAVDSKHKMILLLDVRTDVNDKQHLEYVTTELAQTYGQLPDECRADSDYFTIEAIKQLEQKGMAVYVSYPQSADPKTVKDPSGKAVAFSYDPQKDQYQCSQGSPLKRLPYMITKKGRKAVQYQGTQCQACPLMAQCTRSPKGRIIHRFEDHAWKDRYKKRMKSALGKAKLKQRRCEVEHPYGTIKHWMGKQPLRLRGKDKVQTEISLYHMAYNFKRLINIEAGAFEYLIERIRQFDWECGPNQPQKVG